ncbi:creatininase family protein [bacterium]|nr:creatininase family protein [bacterium]
MEDSFYFADKTWPELEEAVKRNSLIILPIGTIEEHGKHLPVSTDSVIVNEIAKGAAEKLKGEIPTLVLPTLWTGYSAKEMTHWPGTIRVNPLVLIQLIHDILASLIEMGFRKIIILDGHGHHKGIIEVALRQIGDEYGVFPASVSPAGLSAELYRKIRMSQIGGSIHGGEWETSLMLHFKQKVKKEEFTAEDIMRYHSEFVPGDNFAPGKGVFWSTWGIQKSETGIYGDPTKASEETGKLLYEEIVQKLCQFIKEFYFYEPKG